MTDFAILTDASPAAQVRSLAAQYGFHDPHYRGELLQLFDGPGRRMRFLRPGGISLDAFGEVLCDRRVTGRRLLPDEVWQLLSLAFDQTADVKPSKVRPVTKKAALTAIDAQAARAKNVRARKFQCPDCTNKCNGAASTCEVICGRCYRLYGEVIVMERCDPTFAEVMAQTAQADAVPF